MRTIRRAEIKEAAILTDIAIRSEAYWGYDESFMEIFRREYKVTEDFIKSNPTFVLEEDGNIKGFYGIILREIDTELEFLYIDPAVIGTGYGKILWNHMVEQCKLLGVKEFILVTSPQAKAFYEKMGAVFMEEVNSLVIKDRRIPKLKYFLEKKTALLIIDVQNSMFRSIEGTTVYKSEEVLNNILSLLEKARKAGNPVVFIQHTDNSDLEYAEGKETWQLHGALKPRSDEPIIRKSTWDSFHKTILHQVLQKMGVDKLVIAGMQTEFCVDTSCRRAFSMGYDSILVKDGHTTFDSPTLTAEQIITHHNRIMGGRFVKLVEEKDISFI